MSHLAWVPVIPSDFTHEQQLEVLRGLFPFLVFPYKYILQDAYFGQSIHYTANAFYLPAHLCQAAGSWPDLSFCIDSYRVCAIIAYMGETEENIIVEEQEYIIRGSFSACEGEKLRAPNLAYHCVGSSVAIFLPSQIAQCAVVSTSILSDPSVLPKRSK